MRAFSRKTTLWPWIRGGNGPLCICTRGFRAMGLEFHCEDSLDMLRFRHGKGETKTPTDCQSIGVLVHKIKLGFSM